MSPRCIMRYEQLFPAVIPHSKAGCSRVTHPSATKKPNPLSENSVIGSPFDLHVLGTPPAFILSQDQTLNKMVFKEPKSLKSYYRNFSKLQRNLRSSVSSFACLRTTKSISGAFRLSRCLIYKVHAAPCGGFLSYHIQFALSRTFFELFQTLLSSHSPLP